MGLLLILTPFWVHAQAGIRRAVAIIPFWGEDDSVIEQFGDELLFGVSTMKDFAPWPIDMNNLPPDVPQGGFPPFVCPSPSLTRGAPFALTGELTYSDEREQWHLRLYLWQMSDTRLLFSDELTANSREDYAGSLPGMLNWIFSWIPGGEPIHQGGGHSRVVYYAATEPLKWLYAGLRTGGSLRIFRSPENEDLSDLYVNDYRFYENFSIAAHVFGQLIGSFGIQLEAIYSKENEPIKQQSSFTFPGLLRYTYRRGTMAVSAMGGGYLEIPMGTMKDDFLYSPYDPLLGWTAGVTFGNRIGPGYVYIDLRWSADLSDTVKKGPPETEGYRRSMLSLCVGYEAGFFRK